MKSMYKTSHKKTPKIVLPKPKPVSPKKIMEGKYVPPKSPNTSNK